MANIPVERDTSRPWWIWLLGLLLLLLLIWLLVSLLGDDEEEVAVVDPVEEVTPVAPVEPIEAGMDMSSLYVTRVTGDRTFYVAPSATQTDQETLVILNQEASPDAPGIEGQVDINPGQIVNLSAGVREASGSMDYTTMGFGESDMAEVNRLTSTTEVIRIDGEDVEIAEADMDNVEVQ